MKRKSWEAEECNWKEAEDQGSPLRSATNYIHEQATEALVLIPRL